MLYVNYLVSLFNMTDLDKNINTLLIEIREFKNKFVGEQKYENAETVRNIERRIVEIKNTLIKNYGAANSNIDLKYI